MAFVAFPTNDSEQHQRHGATLQALDSFVAYHFEDDSDSSESDDGVLGQTFGALSPMSRMTHGQPKKKKERNLMQRYGVAHHKHKHEQTLLSYEMSETEPRSVANAILQRLRADDGTLRLEELKTAFFGLKVSDGSSKSSDGGVSQPDVHSTDRRGTSISAPPAATTKAPSAGSVAMLRALQNGQTSELEKLRAKNDVEVTTLLGCKLLLCRLIPFFMRLTNRFALPKGMKRRNRRRHRSFAMFSSTAEEVKTNDGGSMRRIESEGTLTREPSLYQSGVVLQAHPSFLNPALEKQLYWEEEEDLVWDAEDDIEEKVNPYQDGPGDVFSLSFSAWRRGLETLFDAIDCNNCMKISWDQFLSFLMEASLLGRVGARDVETKTYDLVRTIPGVPALHGVTSLTHLPSRDQFMAVGTDVSLVLGNSPDFAAKIVVPIPTDPPTLYQKQFRAIVAVIIECGQAVAISCTDSVVRFYSLNRSTVQSIFELECSSNQTSMYCDNDRNLLFLGSRKGELTSYSVKYRPSTGLSVKKAASTVPHTDCISTIGPLVTENGVITTSYDRTIAIHDAKTLKLLKTFSGHASAVQKVVHSLDYNLLVSISFDQDPLVCLVSLSSRPPFPMTDPQKPHIGVIVDMLLIASNASIATIDGKGLIKIWELRNFLCMQTIAAGSHHISPDGQAFPFVALTHTHIEASPEQPLGTTRLYACTRHRMFIFEYNYSQKSSTVKHTADDEPVLVVHFNAENQTFITASATAIRLWDAQTSAIRDTFRDPSHSLNGGVSTVHVHPNGRLYYVGTNNGSLFAHNMSTGGIVYQLIKLHPGSIIGIHYVENAGSRTTSDYVVSISFEKTNVTIPTFEVNYDLVDVDKARCMDFCEISRTLVVGDMSGALALFQSDIIAPMRVKPLTILRLPKPAPREITSCKILRGQSIVACSDDEGHIALFGLRHHATHHNVCIAWWRHVGEGLTPPSIMAMNYFSRRSILYCGDERGFLTAYDLRSLFKHLAAGRQRANKKVTTKTTSSGGNDSKDAHGHGRRGVVQSRGEPTNRDALIVEELKGRGDVSPAALQLRPSLLRELHAEKFGLDRADSGDLDLNQGDDQLQDFSQIEAQEVARHQARQESAFTLDETIAPFVDSPRNHEQAASPIKIEQSLVAISSHPPGLRPLEARRELRTFSKKVRIVNRWKAHHDAVTSITIRNDGMYMVLMSSGIDQVAAGWTLAGGLHMGALDQYGRCGVVLKAPGIVDDIDDFIEHREQLMEQASYQSKEAQVANQPGAVVQPYLGLKKGLTGAAVLSPLAAQPNATDSFSQSPKRVIPVRLPELLENTGEEEDTTEQDTLGALYSAMEANEARARLRGRRKTRSLSPEDRKAQAQQHTRALIEAEQEARREEARTILLGCEMTRPTSALQPDWTSMHPEVEEMMQEASVNYKGMRSFEAHKHTTARASTAMERNPPPVPKLEPFPEGTFSKHAPKATPRRRSRYQRILGSRSPSLSPASGALEAVSGGSRSSSPQQLLDGSLNISMSETTTLSPTRRDSQKSPPMILGATMRVVDDVPSGRQSPAPSTTSIDFTVQHGVPLGRRASTPKELEMDAERRESLASLNAFAPQAQETLELMASGAEEGVDDFDALLDELPFPPSIAGEVARNQFKNSKTVERILNSLWVEEKQSDIVVFRNEIVPDGTKLGKQVGLFGVVASGGKALEPGQRTAVRIHPPPPKDPPRLKAGNPVKSRPRDIMAKSRRGSEVGMEALNFTRPSTANVVTPLKTVKRPASALDNLGGSLVNAPVINRRPATPTADAATMARSRKIDQFVLSRPTHLLDTIGEVIPAVRQPKKLRYGASLNKTASSASQPKKR